ncbi:DUF349 domain-containing protein [Arthrobacter sp. H14]|uniref:DUF349 domain-containing protein n=1 Tax=Arthrobacter sp. H14 TaxID=1312959 RepID=UPI000479B695|nr:DUF349 domain-containing protein [Arthrobacter sp. H14]
MTDSQKPDETGQAQQHDEPVETGSGDDAVKDPSAAELQQTNGTGEASSELGADTGTDVPEHGGDAPAGNSEPASDAAASGTVAPNETAAPKLAASPKPSPRPGPRPTPAAIAPKVRQGKAQSAVAAPPVHSTSVAEASKWARVDDEGHVFLMVDGNEQSVGQYPDASSDDALAYFARKYDDVAGQVGLLEQRVAVKAPTTDMIKTVEHLEAQVAERSMVGDVLALESRLGKLRTDIADLKETERAEHEAAKSAETAAREAIVVEAEQIAGADPATIQWKHSSARMNELFESWKSAQKNGMRLGRGTEDALWKRFRSARTLFDRHRRAYFSRLDSENAAAKEAKEELIKEAEALSDSTDWGRTAGEYRKLMDQWKASKRASRKDDDALWARFRAAQDKFFSARQAANEEIDQEFSANLVVKEELLVEARALLPVKDLSSAKKSLQSIHARWEQAGKVPRSDMARVEAGLREVDEAVRKADEEHWRKSDPETKARTNSAMNQLESTIAGLQDDLETARKAGDQKKIAAAEEALAARQQWLDQIQKSAKDLH